MKTLFSDLYLRLGAAFGIGETQGAGTERNPDDIAKAREVFARLRRLQDEWRGEGVTADDVRDWVREGRQ